MRDGHLERLLKEALAAEARPMSEAQVGEVVARAAARVRSAAPFPVWALVALAAGLAALVLLALSPLRQEWIRILAAVAVAGNLALSPLAALVLVRGRRRAHAS